MKGTLFQLLDTDGENVGLLYTLDEKIKTSELEDIWIEYYDEYGSDPDDFLDYLNDKFNPSMEYPSGIYFERVFVEELNPLK